MQEPGVGFKARELCAIGVEDFDGVMCGTSANEAVSKVGWTGLADLCQLTQQRQEHAHA